MRPPTIADFDVLPGDEHAHPSRAQRIRRLFEASVAIVVTKSTGHAIPAHFYSVTSNRHQHTPSQRCWNHHATSEQFQVLQQNSRQTILAIASVRILHVPTLMRMDISHLSPASRSMAHAKVQPDPKLLTSLLATRVKVHGTSRSPAPANARAITCQATGLLEGPTRLREAQESLPPAIPPTPTPDPALRIQDEPSAMKAKTYERSKRTTVG
jgi:hypothetical protein